MAKLKNIRKKFPIGMSTGHKDCNGTPIHVGDTAVFLRKSSYSSEREVMVREVLKFTPISVFFIESGHQYMKDSDEIDFSYTHPKGVCVIRKYYGEDLKLEIPEKVRVPQLKSTQTLQQQGDVPQW